MPARREVLESLVSAAIADGSLGAQWPAPRRIESGAGEALEDRTVDGDRLAAVAAVDHAPLEHLRIAQTDDGAVALDGEAEWPGR